jgi:hypothetical protein
MTVASHSGVVVSPFFAAFKNGEPTMKVNQKRFLPAAVSLAAVGALVLPTSVSAQDAPLSYKASSEVYKLLAENSEFRVVLATWKPGQHDVQHSHSAGVVYRLTDCRARLYGPDGKVLGEGDAKAGSVVLQDAIGSHSFENIGTSDCQTLLVERK